MIETALGPISDSELGVTLGHEHVLVTMGADNLHYPWLFDWEKTRAKIVRELSEAKSGGVDTVIDLTTPDLGRDVEFFADVAKASGMKVVVATGIWLDLPRSFLARDPDRIADIFVREIEEGIGATGIKAGVIKVANDTGGVTPQAELVLRGAARALKRTGCPISTHQWAPEQVGRRQVEIFQEEGAPMDRICIGHSADTTDVAYLEWLLGTGVYLSMDRYPGRAPDRPDWRQRNATVKALLDRGWAHRLMVGHDHAPPPVMAGSSEPDQDGSTGYLFLSTVALPALRDEDVSDETIDMMLREVPRMFLAGTD
jgi:phosphotriesterase-related protein